MAILQVRFKRNTALSEIQRRMCALGLLLGSQLKFSTLYNGRVAESAWVNVPEEQELNYLRQIKLLSRVESVVPVIG